MNGCTPPASQQLQKNGWIERVNGLGIDGKEEMQSSSEGGEIIREDEGIATRIRSASHYGKCTAVLEFLVRFRSR